jgi:hypothetical protein
MKILRKITLEKKMLSHLSLSTEHIIKYEYTIKMPKGCRGIIHPNKFYCEISTLKEDCFEFGESIKIYYFENEKTYKSLKWLLKSKGLTL